MRASLWLVVDVKARKLVVDSVRVEIEVSRDACLEIRIFAEGEQAPVLDVEQIGDADTPHTKLPSGHAAAVLHGSVALRSGF